MNFSTLSRTLSLVSFKLSVFWTILIIFIVGIFFSAIIPPLQSPDELDHVKRAYLLSKGTILLDAQTGTSSGGMIDSGLLDYMNAYFVFPAHPELKLSNQKINSTKNIQWSGNNKYSAATGAGYYFPLIYMPQAVGLALGEKLNLTVHNSYLLARYMAIFSIAIILAVSFSLYSVNPLVIAMLIMPMTIFQFSSASLDGVSTALTILAISIFLKICKEKTNAVSWLFYILAGSVTLITTSRLHSLSLFILLFVSSFYTKSKKNYLISFILLLFFIIWTAIAIKYTIGYRTDLGESKSSILLFYIQNPLLVFDFLKNTFSTEYYVNYYKDSFLGILGWLDARFSDETYKLLSIILFLITIFSISIKNLSAEWVPRLSLFLGALISIFLIFFIMLVAWTPRDAVLIEGVQGRYFLIPMIMLAYAIAGEKKMFHGLQSIIAFALVLLMGFFTIVNTTNLLLERYYIAQ
jgi:uncharacterized membrane protein